MEMERPKLIAQCHFQLVITEELFKMLKIQWYLCQDVISKVEHGKSLHTVLNYIYFFKLSMGYNYTLCKCKSKKSNKSL